MKKKQIETHGRIEDDTRPTTLDQLWGGLEDKERYGTLNLAEYEARLAEMDRPALEALSRKMGLMIVESTARLRDNLKKEFEHYVVHLRKPSQSTVTFPAEVSATAKRILAEGR